MKHSFRLLLASTAFVGVGCATPLIAKAVETGARCYTPAELRNVMQSEEQTSVVLANRGTEDKSRLNSKGEPTTKFTAQIYFYNIKDRTGYIVDGGVPLSANARPTCERIDTRLTEAVLFDARIDGIDPLANINGDRTLALKECRALQTDLATCYHNDYLRALRERGLNVYFQATVQNHSADGRLLSPTRLTVIGAATLGQPGGVEIISTPEGANVPSAVFGEVGYAPQGYEILEQRSRSSLQSR